MAIEQFQNASIPRARLPVLPKSSDRGERVDTIIGRRSRGGIAEFLVKWHGKALNNAYLIQNPSWEPCDAIADLYPEAVQVYLERSNRNCRFSGEAVSRAYKQPICITTHLHTNSREAPSTSERRQLRRPPRAKPPQSRRRIPLALVLESSPRLHVKSDLSPYQRPISVPIRSSSLESPVSQTLAHTFQRVAQAYVEEHSPSPTKSFPRETIRLRAYVPVDSPNSPFSPLKLPSPTKRLNATSRSLRGSLSLSRHRQTQSLSVVSDMSPSQPNPTAGLCTAQSHSTHALPHHSRGTPQDKTSAKIAVQSTHSEPLPMANLIRSRGTLADKPLPSLPPSDTSRSKSTPRTLLQRFSISHRHSSFAPIQRQGSKSRGSRRTHKVRTVGSSRKSSAHKPRSIVKYIMAIWAKNN